MLNLYLAVRVQARIGHFVEAQILEAVGVDYIDESEVLTPADEIHHINKHNLSVPVLCGCRDLGEALRRIAEVSYNPTQKCFAGLRLLVVAAQSHLAYLQTVSYNISVADIKSWFSKPLCVPFSLS